MRRYLLTLAAVIVLFTGCSDDTDAADPEQTAYDYATEQSGGTTTGCSNAAPGAEAEANPGCIYTVSFSGCLEGLTGEQATPLPVEQEFSDEPALVERYHQAVKDCAE